MHTCVHMHHIRNYVYLYFTVQCSELIEPSNGMMSCSLGGDEVPSYEDTCSFTCNSGYELTGSDTRTCQSDGSWSGSDVTCMEPGMDNYNKTNY